MEQRGVRIGFEFKTSSAPKLTDKNYKAMDILELERLYVIVPEAERYPLGERIEVVGLFDLMRDEVATLS